MCMYVMSSCANMYDRININQYRIHKKYSCRVAAVFDI